MDNESQASYKVTQGKWISSGLAGVCLAFFLAFLSLKPPVTEFCFLFFSLICFSMAFPIYVAFILALIVIPIVCTQPLGEKIKSLNELWWVKLLTKLYYILPVLAFVSLAFHFSYSIGLILLIMSVFVLFALRQIMPK